MRHARAAPQARPAGAMIQVQEHLGLSRSRWPVTVGVPFAAGTLREPSALSLHQASASGASVPLQARVLSRWPDGSIRWALLDWNTDLAARQQRSFVVGRASGATAPRRAAPAVAVKLHDRPDRIEVDTGPLQFAVPKQSFAVLSDVRIDGQRVDTGPASTFLSLGERRFIGKPPSKVNVIDAGPQRVRIELRGEYSAEFGYIIRIDAFAGQPFVRLLHTFEQHGPQPYTAVSQIGFALPLALEGAQAYRVGQAAGGVWQGTLPSGGVVVFQEDNEVVHVQGVRQAGRAAGWANVHDATHGVAVAGRFFWQEYPQSFHLRPSGITYNLWAPEALPAKVGMGTAKTHELAVLFHARQPPGADVLRAISEPLVARVDPNWMVGSGALPNSLAPNAATASFLRDLESSYRRYEEHADSERWDDSGQVFCADPARERPRRGFYGMLNWGDWNFPGYHDGTKGCDAWGNLEYDLTQVLALGYAATGQRAFWEGMIAAGRHFMDVDRIHYQDAHPNWVGMNHPKNPLHFSFELGGVDLGHTWTEGLLSYYYLTGDERGLDAAQGIAKYLVARLASGAQRGNPRQWGWPQIALVAAYEATANEQYRSAALQYARRGMAIYSPDDVAHWKMGILAEGLSYTHAATRDPAIRTWLERYARAVTASGQSPDPRLVPAVAYVGRLTANPAYLRFAEAAVARLRFGSWGKPVTLAGRLGFRVLSLMGGGAHPAQPVRGAGVSASTPTPGTWAGPGEPWNPTPEAWQPIPDPFHTP
jgi:hypothetical protein